MIFRETAMIYYSREHEKHKKKSLLKFVMRYCFGYNVEKTLKFDKYHEIHPTSEQNRVLKKTEKPSKIAKIENNI